MKYMGSKAKYAKYIVPILQKEIDKTGTDIYIECFVGGANIIDKIKCKNRFGFDRSDTLIALLQLAATDFDKVLKEGTRELWDKGKAYKKDGIMPTDMSLADIGAMEFLGSFNNGGFPRGYANPKGDRDYYREAYKNLAAQAPLLSGITFKVQNYWELGDVKGAVIYLDPPYQNTKFYGYANEEKMDYNKFWEWVRSISKYNSVFVSEQVAPEDFEVVWEKEVTRQCNKENNFKAVEKLFRYKGEKY